MNLLLIVPLVSAQKWITNVTSVTHVSTTNKKILNVKSKSFTKMMLKSKQLLNNRSLLCARKKCAQSKASMKSQQVTDVFLETFALMASPWLHQKLNAIILAISALSSL